MEFQRRTKEYATRAFRLVDSLPQRRSCQIMGDQLLRCATSVGSNYRAACRARSGKELCAKLGIVEEEADESLFWMEMLGECGIVKAARLEALLGEGREILAMVASIRTARQGQARPAGQSAIRNPKSAMKAR